MKVTTKGRYALRIMVDLAQQQSGSFIPIKEVSERQDISEKYAEMIVGLLNKAGMLHSARGKGGGYKLARPAESCTVGSVLRASEGSLTPVACLDGPENSCPNADCCTTLPMWTELSRRINGYLDSISIADLAKQVEENHNTLI